MIMTSWRLAKPFWADLASLTRQHVNIETMSLPVPNRVMKHEETQRCEGSHVSVGDQALDP